MEDIQNVLELVRDRLAGFLRQSLDTTETVAVLSNLREGDGTVPSIAENRVVLSLANIEQSTSQSVPVRGGPPTGPGVRFPPLVLTNLYLVILANFTGERYPSGLGMISRVIGFFQDNPVLNRSNLPDLDAAIDSLSFEFVNLDATQWSLYLKMPVRPIYRRRCTGCASLPTDRLRPM
jgi:hypothetical protein